MRMSARSDEDGRDVNARGLSAPDGGRVLHCDIAYNGPRGRVVFSNSGWNGGAEQFLYVNNTVPVVSCCCYEKVQVDGWWSGWRSIAIGSAGSDDRRRVWERGGVGATSRPFTRRLIAMRRFVTAVRWCSCGATVMTTSLFLQHRGQQVVKLLRAARFVPQLQPQSLLVRFRVPTFCRRQLLAQVLNLGG